MNRQTDRQTGRFNFHRYSWDAHVRKACELQTKGLCSDLSGHFHNQPGSHVCPRPFNKFVLTNKCEGNRTSWGNTIIQSGSICVLSQHTHCRKRKIVLTVFLSHENESCFKNMCTHTNVIYDNKFEKTIVLMQQPKKKQLLLKLFLRKYPLLTVHI